MSGKSTGEEEQGYLEHYRETFDDRMKWPFIEAAVFALSIPATLDHDASSVSEVTVEPLFLEHCDKCS